MDASTRAAAVRHAVLEARRSHQPPLPNSRLVDLECEWLIRALESLLTHERLRASFEIVELEQSQHVLVGDYALNIRIDRIDRLSSGGIVILDYKSGRRVRRRWDTPRPDSAQLPFYAAHQGTPPRAIAFALLPLGESGFVGLAEDETLLPKVPRPDQLRSSGLRGLAWSQILSDWHTHTTELVNQVGRGIAILNPLDGACDHCDLAVLCRIPARHDEVIADGDAGVVDG
jgi:hypothetical protein